MIIIIIKTKAHLTLSRRNLKMVVLHWNPSNIFVHTTNEKITGHFGFDFEENSHGYREAIVLEKLRFRDGLKWVGLINRKKKSLVFKFLRDSVSVAKVKRPNLV